MSVVALLVGGLVYGAYSWLKKTKPSKQSEDDKVSLEDMKEVIALKENVEALALGIYHKIKPWNEVVEQLNSEDKENHVWILLEINAAVYRVHGISGGGIFITENNLSSALENLTATQFCMHDAFGFFAISTAQGKVLYFKNEFYQYQETNETLCVYTTIENLENHTSPIVGIGYTAESQLFAIGYGDGTLRLFDARDATELKELRTYQLGLKNIRSMNTAASVPVFATLNDNYEEEVWNIPKDNIAKSVSSQQMKQFFDVEHKLYLNSAMLEKELDDNLRYYLAINNTIDQKIELYTYRNGGYECVLTIPYEGSITCSAFCQKQFLFAFYQKGGEQEGVHIWNIDHAVQGGYFTPASKNQQHPIQISINNDKVFCLYENGLMDMWHCQADRQKIARESLNKIVNALPYKLKIEFLRQFGAYLEDRSPENYHLLVSIGSAGMSKREVEIELMMLQFLNPDFADKTNNAMTNQNESEK